VSRSKDKSAERVAITNLRKQAEAYLDEAFAAKKTDKDPTGSSKGSAREKESAEHSVWFEGGLVVDDLFYPWLYLNRKTLKERGLKQDDVQRKLSEWLMKQPAVLSVYSHQQLVDGVRKNDEIGQRQLLSFRRDRSGDLGIVPKPYSLIYAVTGTSHGSPYSYDTHVPLLLYGSGVEAGIHTKPIIPQAGTVLLARSLGISPPAAAEETLAEAYLDAATK
jgi:hypothetical protein